MLYTLAASLALLIGPLPQGARRATPPTMSNSESLNFLNPDQCRDIKAKVGTPCFVYDEATLKRQATTALSFPNAYGLTVRFAMKASPNAAILKTFDTLGLHIDASSGFEVRRAVAAGISAEKMSLSSQETPHDLGELLDLGIKFNACSLKQLEAFGKLRKGDRSDQLGVRFNPGLGSGGTGKTNVGGPASSFGIWYELMPEVKAILAKYDLEPARVHTHIGSGSDPAVWQRTSGMSLDLVKQLPTVKILNLGGGYKVGRMSTETSTDLGVIGAPVRELFESFAKDDGRELKLEIEPGTFLVANSASLLTTVQDIVWPARDDFLKLDSGMKAPPPLALRLAAPGGPRAAHRRRRAPPTAGTSPSATAAVGRPGDARARRGRTLGPRALGGEAQDGDLLVIEGAGAYCSSMCTKNYNSFPEAPEVMLDGNVRRASSKKQPSEIWQNRWRTRRAQARPDELTYFLISDDRDDSRQASRGTAQCRGAPPPRVGDVSPD